METFTFRFAMSIDIKAKSDAEAREIFETMPFNEIFEKGDYVELEDVYQNR